MDVLDTEIKRMETYLDNVENSFTNLQDDNFDSCMERIKINISKFEDTKNELIKNNSRELLRRRSQGLGQKVKQIYQRFDNVIKEKKSEQDKLKSLLLDSLNQKKLNNYKR
ncbi:hypothetical protein BMS3Abin04_00534 [bacterium BMS3Abin04]|nr:hypothetical protein BMS3Abin04_00534 [bacterium BMS3Abin04]